MEYTVEWTTNPARKLVPGPSRQLMSPHFRNVIRKGLPPEPAESVRVSPIAEWVHPLLGRCYAQRY